MTATGLVVDINRVSIRALIYGQVQLVTFDAGAEVEIGNGIATILIIAISG